MKHVLVVGGGVSGLIAAFEVVRQAEEAGVELSVAVLEADPERFGGKARTEERDGFVCEEGPNGFLNSKPPALTLVDRLGIEDRLLPSDQAAALRFIFSRGKLRQLPGGALDFLFSPILSPGAKLRFLKEPWVRPAPPDADETLLEFATRRLGPQAARRLLDPMVSGVYAGDVAQVSVRAAFPRIHELEQKHGSLVRGMLAVMKERRAERKAGGAAKPAGGPAGPAGALTSFIGGMRELVDALVERIPQEGRHMGWRAVGIAQAAPGGDGGASYEVRARNGRDRERIFGADAVIVATEASHGASIVRALDHALAEPLAGIPYASAALVGLGFLRSELPRVFRGFGFLIPSEERRRILGCLWTSSVFPGRRSPEDRFLFRTICGGAHRPELVERSPGDLVTLVREELREMAGIEAEPCFAHVKRWPNAIPQYTVGHVDRVAALDHARARWPGLFFTGNSLRGIALPECAASGDRVAAELVSYLCQT